jgi:aminopeptidase N
MFFDQWVYGTGIPTLTMTYSVKGNALTGKVTQSGVDPDFNVAVPIEIQLTRDRSIAKWVRTENGAAAFTVALNQPPLKVTLDPHYAVLRK